MTSGAISQDPVCGQAHCALAPFWATKLNKNNLIAFQVGHAELYIQDFIPTFHFYVLFILGLKALIPYV